MGMPRGGFTPISSTNQDFGGVFLKLSGLIIIVQSITNIALVINYALHDMWQWFFLQLLFMIISRLVVLFVIFLQRKNTLDFLMVILGLEVVMELGECVHKQRFTDSFLVVSSISAVLEALPSAILQQYVALVIADSSTTVVVSVLTSMLTLAISLSAVTIKCLNQMHTCFETRDQLLICCFRTLEVICFLSTFATFGYCTSEFGGIYLFPLVTWSCSAISVYQLRADKLPLLLESFTLLLLDEIRLRSKFGKVKVYYLVRFSLYVLAWVIIFISARSSSELYRAVFHDHGFLTIVSLLAMAGFPIGAIATQKLIVEPNFLYRPL
mmetsp:Transcript_35347/g.40134  ORF Transcript_35347/g.40134 Transcript_35347/m.40134 type:complete len:325 (-) Transcript_35347:419-1393(-)